MQYLSVATLALVALQQTLDSPKSIKRCRRKRRKTAERLAAREPIGPLAAPSKEMSREAVRLLHSACQLCGKCSA